MTLPSRIVVRVTANGHAVGGMFICIKLKMSVRNDFDLVFGPTDDEGGIIVTRENLLSEADKDRSFFLMDYGDPEQDFTGEIIVTALNRESLERALTAYEMFSKVWKYPVGYLEDLHKAHTKLDEMHTATLSLNVQHDEESVVIEARPTPI